MHSGDLLTTPRYDKLKNVERMKLYTHNFALLCFQVKWKVVIVHGEFDKYALHSKRILSQTLSI